MDKLLLFLLMRPFFSFNQTFKAGTFLMFMWCGPYAFAQYFSATVYKDQDGLLSNRINNLIQMPGGEMAFLTDEGLSIYDGLAWEVYPDSLNLLPQNGKIMMKVFPDSSLYVFGAVDYAYVLVKIKNGRYSQIDLPSDFDKIQGSETIDIDSDTTSSSYGQIALSYLSTVHLFDGEEWTALGIGDSQAQIYKLHLRNDSLLMGTNHGLHLFHDHLLYPIVSNEQVLDFVTDSGYYYLLGEDWIGKFSNDTLTKYLKDKPIGLKGGYAITSFYHEQGKLYYSYNSPLYTYDIASKKSYKIITRSYSDEYTAMKALFDHGGNLWVATMRGAFKISNIDVYSYNQTQLIEDEVTAILEAENGDIYLGANSGFSVLKKDGGIEFFYFSENLIQPRVMDIVEYQGVIYLAANTAGILSLKDGKVSYAKPDGTNTRALDLQVHQDKLFASSNGRLYQKEGEDWKLMATLTPEHSMIPMIRKILFTDEAVYFLTPQGVYNCTKQQYLAASGQVEGNAYSSVIHNGKIWLGTLSGLAEIRDEVIVLADEAQDPFKFSIYSLLVDREGRLWMGGDEGVLHVKEDATVTHLSKDNGLIGNEINRNALVQLKDGRLMIGTDQGVSLYEPNSNVSFPIPGIAFTGISVNDKSMEGRHFRHDQNNIRFQFRSISFYDEKLVNYRYRLIGFENKWQTIPYHNQRSVLYTNMEPGTYRFVVQGRVGTGGWSRRVSSGVIRIHPAVYNTTWFQVLLLLVLTGIILLVFRFRSRHLKKTNQLLQDGIRAKTEELHNQNNELIKTITELKTTQGQLIQSEKLASMGQLTAGIAHEMNNPLNYIRGGAECLRKNLSEINELHIKIVTGGERRKVLKLRAEYEYLINESKQLLESILSGAEKSTNIVKSLNSFTADAQNFYSFIELEREVETALTLLGNQIGFHIHINKFFGNTPKIECYPAKIHQLLVNLLLNSIQAIKDEGEIGIRIYRKDDKNVALEISDNGEGIQEEYQEKIFEPFYTTKDSNPGLGLTMVKAIVQDHHGEIRFDSKKGKGSKVTVILPLQQTFHPELDDYFAG